MDRPEELQQNPMDDNASDAFERDLRDALRRVDAPKGFADRVMQRIDKEAETRKAKLLVMPARWRPWLSGALAAGLAIAVTAGELHARHQREEAAQAQQQFETAMQITGDTLDHVRSQLQRAGIDLGR